jgi:triacylglycerol lipase
MGLLANNPTDAAMIPRLELPIVLVHGLFGFDRIQVGALTIANYFPGIVEALQLGGNRVFVPSLSPTAGVEDRAKQLREFLRCTCPYDRVHLIAHSMGGLDARFMISRLGMASQVASLTTLGTPHRGTAFADWGVSKVKWFVKPTLDLLQMPHQAFDDLTSSRCQEFNAMTPDAHGVRYHSVAAEYDGNLGRPEWLLPHAIVRAVEGPNDGVVSIASARYGESFDVWPGDHFSLVNWVRPNSHPEETLERWRTLIQRLETPQIGHVEP